MSQNAVRSRVGIVDDDEELRTRIHASLCTDFEIFDGGDYDDA